MHNGLMPRVTKHDVHLATISAETARVLASLNPLDLCSYRVGNSTRSWETGVHYDATRRYPYPPLRAHPPHAPSVLGCADCSDFDQWRAKYVEWAQANSGNVMPEMVAPAGLPGDRINNINMFHLSADGWIALVAAMIDAAVDRTPMS